MPNRLLTPASMATLIYLTTTTAVSAQTGTMSTEQSWSAISRCAQEDTERGRHTCVDRVLRDAGLLTSEMRAKQQQRAFGLDDKPARTTPPAAAATTAPANAASAAPAAATSPAASTSTAATAANSAPAQTNAPAATRPAAPTASPATGASAAPSAEPPDRVDVQLTKVVKAPNGRLAVTTSDGAVWLQTESVSMPLPPAAGDRMSIRKATLGGYVCSVTNTHLTYRCSRSR